MAQVNESIVTLRISGDDLNPSKITSILGHAPCRKQIKGQRIESNNTSKVRIANIGMWSIRATNCEPENLNSQTKEILGKLTSDLTIWKELSSKYRLELFTSLFLGETNEGMELFPESMQMLGNRGIILGLDIYSPMEETKDFTE